MRNHFIALTAAVAALLTLVLSAAASPDPLTNARDATAAFNDQASAQAAGYNLLTDAAGIACIDQPVEQTAATAVNSELRDRTARERYAHSASAPVQRRGF
jgi:hypothetical protein